MRLRESALASFSRCSAEVLSGRYRLDARIGSGGAADVHRGYDLRLRRAVAVKVFRPGAAATSEEGFESEAVILARLQHPGLVTAYDAGRHDGRSYLVMQLIEGSTLRARIAEGVLSCARTAALGADLARALAHAHEAGIVHRDVKPSNILLDASDRPYLTDFGISRLVDATTRTATGALVGTAAYLAPEQVLGRPVGRPADVYALGLVLLECLTGRLEYDGGPLEAAIARLHRPPVLPDGIPVELAALLRGMTALDEPTRPCALDCANTLAALADSPLSEPVRTAGALGAVVAPPETAATAGASVVRSRERARGDEATHPAAVPVPRAAAAKPAARGRVLVAGGAVALAGVMAAALAVTDGYSQQEGQANTTGAVSRPAGKGGADGGPTAGNGASPAPGTPSAPPGDASHVPLRAATSARSAAPSSGRAGKDPADVRGASVGAASGGRAPAERRAPAHGKPSDKAAKVEKAAKAEKAAKPVAQPKSAGKKPPNRHD